jgi:hypothetical protein
MFLETYLSEYAEEIRREVCSHCPERPSCVPLGKLWGADQPGLIGRFAKATQRIVGATPPRNPPVCQDCARVKDFLSNLLTQAVEEAGGPAEQWQVLHRRLNRPAAKPGATITQLYLAYEEATGTMIGCD